MRNLEHALALLLFAAAGCAGGSEAPPAAGPGEDPLAIPHQASQVLLMLDSEELTEEEEENEADEILGRLSGLKIERIGQTSFFVLSLPAGADLKEILKDLDGDAQVVVSELDYVVSGPEGGPDDVPTLGSDVLSSIRSQPALAALRLPEAQALSRGAGVVVAVLDTGVDFGHPFLAGQLAAGGFDFIGRDSDPSDERDGLDNDGDGIADEQFGHGTFVASLILAVAPDAMVLPVRVLDAEGFGTASTVAAGIVWAVDAGAQVINISVDIPTASEAVKEAISYAEDRDVLVVAAAGNGASTTVVFPARFGAVIAVAAVNAQGMVSPSSNTGSDVDMAAPGVGLIGAFPESANPSGTARWSGTSFASPIVAGSAALVRSAFPGLEAGAAAQRLADSAAPLDQINPGSSGRLGEGLVQPLEALR